MSVHVKVPGKMPGRQVLEAAGVPHPHGQAPAGAKGVPHVRPRADRVSSMLISWKRTEQYMRDDPLPETLGGIRGQELIESHVLATAAEFDGSPKTIYQFMGRYWERSLLDVPDVRVRLGDHLAGALEMQEFFLRRIHSAEVGLDANGRRYGGLGFFDANGETVPFLDKDRLALAKRTQAMRQQRLTSPTAWKKAGIRYVDRFSINNVDFVDGAFLMDYGGYTIVLLRVEAKTIGSQGVSSQLGAFFVRLASSGRDDVIQCHQDGRLVPLPRERLLFNPTWTDAGVGVQAWLKRDDVWTDARRTDTPELVLPNNVPRGKTLESRVKSAAGRIGGIGQPTGFLSGPWAVPPDLEGLERLAVSGPVIYSKADLSPLRSWLERLTRVTSSR
ncbi:hypothetical protein [Lysobacter tyrosinilyticus]